MRLRTCGQCGVPCAPFGVDWPYWIAGQPACLICAGVKVIIGIDPASNKQDSAVVATFKNNVLVEFHDFRDTGDPMEKNYPINDWRSWERQQDPKAGK